MPQKLKFAICKGIIRNFSQALSAKYAQFPLEVIAYFNKVRTFIKIKSVNAKIRQERQEKYSRKVEKIVSSSKVK